MHRKQALTTTFQLLSICTLILVAFSLPLLVSDYRVFQLTMVMIYAIALTGLNLLTGYNGQISIGHGALFGLGAYTGAILILRAGAPVWLAVVCAGAVGFVVGWLFGRPALRLHGHYLALATFGLAVATPTLLRDHRLERWTGGVQGLVLHKVEPPFHLKIGPDRWLYYLTLTVMALLLVIAWNLVRGRIGRALVAIRDHSIAAEAMGVPSAHYKTLTFGVSALYAGVAGALSALVVQYVAPDSFPALLSVSLLVGVIVGGSASISGAIYGAFFLVFVPNLADQLSKDAGGAVYGLLLIVAVFLMPGGIAQTFLRLQKRSPWQKRLLIPVGTLCGLALLLAPKIGAGKWYGPGVTSTEIRIGQTVPYSGPFSGYSPVGYGAAAYFQMVNDNGGIKGRRVQLISLDDQNSPPKTLETTRRLVEQEDVLLLFFSNGTAAQTAVHEYLNAKKVPQLLVATGADKWNDPAGHPWTITGLWSYSTEGELVGKWLLEEHAHSRVAILYQNDDFGRDYVRGFKHGLGTRAVKMIVAEQSYEGSAPGVDAQMIALAGSGADTFLDASAGKFVSLAIRQAVDGGWKPVHLIVGAVATRNLLKAAGLEKASGLIGASAYKDPGDPQWNSDPDVKAYLHWVSQYLPGIDPLTDTLAYVYNRGRLLQIVLERCGDDLSRENVMRQITNLKDVELPLLLPGVKINTSPTDYLPIEQLQLRRFDGQKWVPFGELLGPS
jgi:branched-chain amino acid transport system substrate-binding protein